MIFENFENPRIIFDKSAKYFVCFCFSMQTKKTLKIEIEDEREA